jgi:hypothetical protein
MIIFYLFTLTLMTLCSAPFFGKNINSQFPSIDDSLKIVEKVYLHADRDSYYPGDDIWFKTYLIDASDRHLSNHSNNLHVELISPSLKIIESRIVKLNEGLGNGDFHLPESLKSGRYRIRAYTNYMRNLGDQLFFNKDIIIINSSDAAKALSDSIIYIKNKLEISFFPEGGSLVENVLSIVAFKSTDANGYATDVSGEIYSSTGELVTAFKSTHKGMGTFSLNPVPGLRYYAITKNQNGDLVRYEIPKSFSTGVAFTVSKNKVGKLSLTFKTNPETLPLVLGRDLSLTVSARNIAFKTYSFRMKSLNSVLNILTDDLPEGIVMLTLSGLDNIPLCERLVYLHNNEDAKIILETNKILYNQRDSISVKISLRVNSRIAQDAFLSLSATENILTDNSSGFPSTISSWFLLESDVRGPVEEPSYYFDPSNPNRLKDLDILLLTQGWRDFEWKYKNMNFPPEYGFTISGRVRKKFADVPLKNSKVNLAIFTSGNPLIRTIPTDSSGRFWFKGVDLTGDAKLIASVTGDKDNLMGWLLLDSIKYSSPTIKESLVQNKLIQNNDQFISDDQLINEDQLIKKNLHTFIQYAEIKNSIRKKYKLSDTITPGEVTIVARRQDEPESARSRSRRYLMGTPDRELVITPQSQIYNDIFGLLVSNMILRPWSYYGMHNPLYLINGNISSKDDVKALSVSWVERIDILDNMASIAVWGSGTGDVPIDGVISIILKNDFATNRTSVFHSVNIKFSGYNEPRIFYSPKHHTKLESDYKPDLRTTLFWEPNIKVENNKDFFVNYYNADNSSKIKVIVEGITSTGIPVTGKTEYEVK